MEKEIEIKSINLTIGKKEILLTIDEAKKLKKTLEALFEKETVIKEVRHYETPKWIWNYPIYPYYDVSGSDKIPAPYFEVKCDNNSNAIGQLMAKI